MKKKWNIKTSWNIISLCYIQTIDHEKVKLKSMKIDQLTNNYHEMRKHFRVDSIKLEIILSIVI